MRTRIGTILIAVVSLVVGAAAGWFAGRARSPNVPDAKVSAPRASEQSTRTSGVGAHRPAANVVDKPRRAAVKASADERREAGTAKQEEKPAQVAQPELQKDDNPFPRYLDMFKNNPEALTAERLYEQLEFSGISDADAQNIIYRAAYNTSFSYECLEPSLQIYDKVYKNMGVGNGIFSWCSRARRNGGK